MTPLVSGLLFAASGTPDINAPETVVLRTIVGDHIGACIRPDLLPLTIAVDLRQGEAMFDQLEASGQLRWRNGHAEVGGDLKKATDAHPPSGPLPNSREEMVEQGLGQWLHDAPGEPKRMEPLPSDESRSIGHAALLAARAAHSPSADKLDPTLLPAGIRIEADQTVRCRPTLQISHAAFSGDWAFVSTSVIRHRSPVAA